jgi:hypothetical protein
MGRRWRGRRGAKEGLRKVVAGLQQGVESLSGALAAYRMFLYLEGSEEREAVDENGKPVRGALRREAVLKVLREKGKLPLGAYLRCRVRYFCDGAVFGSREFVEGMFRARRGWFGERRKSGARKMRGLLEGELFTVRDLRVDVFVSRRRSREKKTLVSTTSFDGATQCPPSGAKRCSLAFHQSDLMSSDNFQAASGVRRLRRATASTRSQATKSLTSSGVSPCVGMVTSSRSFSVVTPIMGAAYTCRVVVTRCQAHKAPLKPKHRPDVGSLCPVAAFA